MRDLLARRLVALGLRVATPDGRSRIMHTVADHWRAAVKAQRPATEEPPDGFWQPTTQLVWRPQP